MGSKQGVEINEKSVTMDVVTATNSLSTKQAEEVPLSSAGHSSSCNIASTPCAAVAIKLLEEGEGGQGGRTDMYHSKLVSENSKISSPSLGFCCWFCFVFPNQFIFNWIGELVHFVATVTTALAQQREQRKNQARTS